MLRLFDEHITRKCTFLDGAWKFCTDPEDKGEAENYKDKIPAQKTVIVPSVWQNELGLFNYNGAVWYEKDFYFDGVARLVFEAVMTECKVWLDGEYIGYHYGGFCQFDFIVPNLKAGVHKLVLKADNRFDEISIPQKTVDWYPFGGITRSVSVEKLCGVAVTYGKFDYTLSEDRTSAQVWFTAELYGADKRKETEFKITLDGKTVYSQKVALKKGSKQTVVTPKIEIDDIKLWDINSPYLYTLVFSTDTDDLIDKIGFRTIEVKDAKIWLNGRTVEIRGVNRHEDHPDFGMALPANIMTADLDVIEDLGCNSIRGSHYPNARIFLDMLDERGILFWSEIPIWGCGFKPETLADKRVVERGLEMHREMVKYYYNHPSIVFWGMHNEIKVESEAARDMSKIYYNYLKDNGGNRLVTYATCSPMVDICFEYCDVMCLNQYYGWYSGTREDWPDFLQKFSKRREELGFGKKPVIMSEFGGASIYGYNTFDDVKWTEEYLAKYHSTCLQVFHDTPFIVGFYIWQFCNSHSNMTLQKARNFNNKGILNEYRKPKAAYYAVKEKYHKFKKEFKD